MESTQQMLRAEALNARSSAALGSVVLIAPGSLQVAVRLILAVLCAGAALLYFGTVPTLVTMSGKVNAAVAPTPLSLGENAKVLSFLVEDGQAVARNTPLLTYCSISATPSMTEPNCTGAPQTLSSPSDGSVALQSSVRIGDPLSPSMPALALHAQGTPLKVVFKVPEAALGDVRTGQRVRLHYARYGAPRYRDAYGNITKIGSAPIAEKPAYFSPEPATDHYEVTVLPDQPWVEDGSQRLPLQLRMSVEAKVITRELRIYQWLWMRV